MIGVMTAVLIVIVGVLWWRLGRSPEPLPWFRVVRSNRTLAFAEGSSAYREQAQLLRQEGVGFDGLKIVEVETDDSLDRILWGPTD